MRTGKLWFYNGFGGLMAMDVKNPEPRMVDEQRLIITLKRGQVELRTRELDTPRLDNLRPEPSSDDSHC
jgi:hypothetical protein